MRKKTSHTLLGKTRGKLSDVSLIESMKIGSSNHYHTYTAVASRLLRTNILAPLTGTRIPFLDLSVTEMMKPPISGIEAINARLDVVAGTLMFCCPAFLS